MPRKPKYVEEEEEEDEELEDLEGDEEEQDEDEDESQSLPDLERDELPKVEPYKVLDIEKTATADEIKLAYRKAALKNHPDKAPPQLKDEATTKFQEIAFAYAVLSDPIRRKRYDVTGSTAESLSIDQDFSWASFYDEQFRDIVTSDAIEAFSKAYKGSDEEKDDVLAAYENGKGEWGFIYETVMLSNPLEDEERFAGYIEEAIEKGEVEKFTAYTKESKRAKKERMNAAKGEAAEAEELAKKLEVHDKLFKKGKASKDNGEDALKALIQGRSKDRGSFFDHLEAKYGGQQKKGKKGKKGKGKRGSEEVEDGEPSEEAFQATRARMESRMTDGEASGGRKAKKAKR